MLRRPAMSKQPRFAWPAAILAAALLAAASHASAATMPAVNVKVVHQETGAALAGVTVMLWNTAHQGNLSGHGGTRLVLFAVESSSDESGAVVFPAQQFDGPPLLSLLQTERPQMLLLKPGFAPVVLDQDYHLAHGLRDGALWERGGVTVAMRPSTPEQRHYEALAVVMRTQQLLEPGKKCAWQQVPNTLVAEHRMYQGYSTVVQLQAQDARLVQLGCESPLAFFKRYGVERASPFERPRPTAVIKVQRHPSTHATPQRTTPAHPTQLD